MINRSALEAALRQAEPGELLAAGLEIVGRGAAAMAQAKDAPAPAPPSRSITPAEAGRIAGVPDKRIYDWARGKRWAHRPTRRCLRIDEAGFRRWLESRP